jgi:transposase
MKSPVLHNNEIGKALIGLIDDVFKNYRYLQVSGDLKTYFEWTYEFKLRLNEAFNQWIPKASATALNLLAKLRDKYHQWWYCLDHPEVPPDHNLAERSLRLAVTKRKISGGSRSLDRFGDTANLLTVVQTCRSQERYVIDFFASAIQAHTRNQIIVPSLIPSSAT